MTDDDPPRSGHRLQPFLFFAEVDDLSWARPGDHLISEPDGPTKVLGDNGEWVPL